MVIRLNGLVTKLNGVVIRLNCLVIKLNGTVIRLNASVTRLNWLVTKLNSGVTKSWSRRTECRPCSWGVRCFCFTCRPLRSKQRSGKSTIGSTSYRFRYTIDRKLFLGVCCGPDFFDKFGLQPFKREQQTSEVFSGDFQVWGQSSQTSEV